MSAPRDPGRPVRRRPRVTAAGAIVAASVLAGGLLRLEAATGRLGWLDSDEGVTGLMARHALDGELTAFWWGQTYGGSLEPLLTAAAFGVAGAGTVALRLVPVLLWGLACVLVWCLGRRTVGADAAVVGACLLWLWPAYGVWKSTRAHGYYGVLLVCAVATLLAAVRLRESGRPRDAALLGAAIGLGWWTSPQIALAAVPALAWLAWRPPPAIRTAWALVPAVVVTALPWLAWNLANGWGSFRLAPGGGSYGSRLRGLATATLPMIAGLRTPFSSDWPVGRAVAVAVLAVAAVAVAIALRRTWPEVSLLALVLVLFPVLYAASPFTWLTGEPRYLVLLLPVLALLLGRVLVLAGRRAAIAGLAAAAVLSLLGLRAIERAPSLTTLSGGVPVPADVGPLVRALDAHGISAGLADYWIAYRVTFLTGERIALTPTPGSGVDRWQPLTRRARAAPCATRIAVAGGAGDAPVVPAGAVRFEAGGFAVVTRCPSPRAPAGRGR